MRVKKGFTLIELIVVLAILAILAAIAIPTAFGSIEKAKASACAGSRADLLSALRVETALEAMDGAPLAGGDIATVAGLAAADCGGVLNNMQVAGFCPGGERYAYTLTYQDAVWAVSCEKHGDTESFIVSMGNALTDDKVKYTYTYANILPEKKETNTLAGFIRDYFADYNPNNGTRRYIDSSSSAKADGSQTTQKVQQGFAQLGFDVAGKAWTVSRIGKTSASEGYFVYVTEENLSTYQVGAAISVQCYDSATAKVTTKEMYVRRNSAGEYVLRDAGQKA